jgi:CDP-4-dehydro-6-deoxyglucose reductase
MTTFQCRLLPSEKSFELFDYETILEAALRAQLVLPYGCKDGACGSCKAKLVEGEVDYGNYQIKALTEDERNQGSLLLCQARPKSNLVLEARVVAAEGMIPIRKLPCRVASLDYPAQDVAILRLQLPASERFQFHAGQYVDILLKDGKRRSYSMANPPLQAEQLELHIRQTPGGAFTDAVFGQPTSSANAIKQKDILRFEGPMGSFSLCEETRQPIVFVASGTGFAPIKAMIEHARSKNFDPPMRLYWGGRRPSDLYMMSLAQQWAAEMPHFQFVPVVSDAEPEDQWQGRTGFVHKAVMQDFPDLSGHLVYACGAPVVVSSAQKDFVEYCKLSSDNFFSDAFTTAADLASSKPEATNNA